MARVWLPVAITYVLAAVELQARITSKMELGQPPTWAFLWLFVVILLFTLLVTAGPVWAFAEMHKRKWRDRALFFVGMGLFYGLPIVLVALIISGWLISLGAALHVLLARRASRAWVFLEYGSTSFGLFLLLMFAPLALFPWGILVAIAQGLLLALVELKFRPLWIDQPPDVARVENH